MPAATHQYQSVVRNISGATMFFDWIGEHGATLANNADAVVPGNIFALWAKDKKKQAAMAYALENGKAVIVALPTVLGYDAGWGAVRVLKFNNGTVTGQDLDTGSYAGAAPSYS